MKYELWTQKEDDPAAIKVYEMTGSKTVWYAPCGSCTCRHCHNDETLYRVCPTCARGLIVGHTIERPYRCLCGTVIYVCGRTGGPTVTRYIKSPVPMIEEDTI